MNILIERKAIFIGHLSSVYALAVGKLQNQFFSAGGDGWLVEWDLNQPELGHLIAKTDVNIFSIAYDEKREWSMAGDMYGGLHWINLKSRKNFKSSQFHQKGIFGIKQLNDNILLTLGGEGSLGIWDIEKNSLTAAIEISPNSLRAVAFHSTKPELAIASSDKNIYIIDSVEFKVIKKIENAHLQSVFSIEYSPDGKFLLSGGRDAFLRIWDIDQNYLGLPTDPAHLFTINSIALHPELPVFATASRDKTIKIWSLENFSLLKVIDNIRYGAHNKSVNHIKWLDASTLLSCSDDRTIVHWDFTFNPI
jgi:WD40 repeat protein